MFLTINYTSLSIPQNVIIVLMVKILHICLFHSLHLESVLTAPHPSGTDRPGQAPKTTILGFIGTSTLIPNWFSGFKCGSIINAGEQWEEKTTYFCVLNGDASSYGRARGFSTCSLGLWSQWEVLCEGCSPAPSLPMGITIKPSSSRHVWANDKRYLTPGENRLCEAFNAKLYNVWDEILHQISHEDGNDLRSV